MIDSRTSISRVPAIAGCAFLALAMLGRWPYSFYTVLRLVVCGTGVYYAMKFQASSRPGWMWSMVAVAIVFNPIVPIGFARSTWVIVDGCAAGFLLVALCQPDLWKVVMASAGNSPQGDGTDWEEGSSGNH